MPPKSFPITFDELGNMIILEGELSPSETTLLTRAKCFRVRRHELPPTRCSAPSWQRPKAIRKLNIY